MTSPCTLHTASLLSPSGKWPYTIKTMSGQGTFATTQFDDHTKMRRLLAPAFSPKAVAGLLPRMSEIIGQGLEAWAARGSIKALEETRSLSFKVDSDLPEHALQG